MTLRPDPAETHRLEQLAAGQRDMAVCLWGHYTNLVAEGFTPDEAMQLTISYQNVIIMTVLSKPRPPAAADDED